MVEQYIDTRPIMDLCLDMYRRQGSHTPIRWWEQEGLVFPGRTVEGKEG